MSTTAFNALNIDVFVGIDFTNSVYVSPRIDGIISELLAIQSRNTSTRVVKSKHISTTHPWTNNKIYHRLQNFKKLAKARYAKHQSELNRLLWRQCNINVQLLYNDLKFKYYSRLVSTIGDDARKFYGLMRNKNKQRNILPIIMKFKGVQCSGMQRIINLRKNLESCSVTSEQSFSTDTELFNEQLQDLYRIYYPESPDNIWDDYINWFGLTEITEIINSLDDKSDAGPMALSVAFVKFNVEYMAPIILKMCNVILHTGVIPSAWKHSYITPIPKKGTLTDIENYRGIAMQSVIPKIFDKALTAKLYYHLQNTIPHCQHGFVKYTSKASNLAEITNFLHENLGKRSRVDVVHFDFSKAFDHVDHRLLAIKLSKLGMPNILFQVVMNFISNCSYTLKVDGTVYEQTFHAPGAVPQGSHCAPLLYLVISSDLVSCVANTDVKPSLYADDTTFYRVVNNEDDEKELQLTIDRLSQWADSNKLTLNKQKTFHISYAKRPNTTLSSQYHLGAERITKKAEGVDLGITFDDKLTFIPHITASNTRLSKIYSMGNRFAKEIRYIPILLKIINTCVMPVAEYCSPIRSQNRITIEKSLEKTLHYATRAALRTPFRHDDANYVSFNQRLKKLGMLTYGERRHIASIIFHLKILRGEIKSELCKLLRSNSPVPSYTSRSPNIFVYNRRNIAPKSPIQIAMALINQFKNVFDFDDSIDVIRKKLKTHFLDMRTQ